MSGSIDRKRPRSGSLSVRCGTRFLSLMALSALTTAAVTTSAFQLNMVATHGAAARASRLRSRTAAGVTTTTTTRTKKPAPLSSPSSLPPPPAIGGGGVTSSLISNLAVVALKLRLADHNAVTCDVTGSSSDLLLRGTVGPVTVRGRGWSSQLGLTCRAIEATVNRCHLDMGAVVGRRKLVLTTPAKGDALIALNGADFANFIKHPLMKPPSLPGSDESFQFLRDEVDIDVSNQGGSVIFYGEYMDRRWRCELTRGSGQKSKSKGALVSVVPATHHESDAASDQHAETSAQLTEVLSQFFNEMVFELDGTYLSFKDMMITSKGDAPSVMLALSITVKKFPSAGLAF